MMVLAMVLVGTLIVAALAGLVMVNLSATRAYRGRTDTVQQSNSAIDLAIARKRGNATQGVDGATSTVSYDGIDVTCVGASGSGAVGVNSVADRIVTCSAEESGSPRVRVRIRFVDQGGNNPGAEVEIIDREVFG